MSIFSETITRAISDYRALLRRYLKQEERQEKLIKFGLKDDKLYQDDLRLYETAWAIIEDAETSMAPQGGSYYSYSGISKFCEFLKDYLKHYSVEGDNVIHSAQKASRAMIKAIQYMAQPLERLTPEVSEKLIACNSEVVQFGAEEQHELYLTAVKERRDNLPEFFDAILDDFAKQREAHASVVEEAADERESSVE